jgi:pilus assembly protein Flp/PilA
MIETLKNLHKDESGQDLIEYALLAALIASAATVSMSSLASKVASEFGTIGAKLT